MLTHKAIRADTIKPEAVVDCLRGSPWQPADMGNLLEHRFNWNADPESPDAVFTMEAHHWAAEDRARGLLTVYRGVTDARVIVFHHDMDYRLRRCLNCNTVIGTPNDGTGGWMDT